MYSFYNLLHLSNQQVNNPSTTTYARCTCKAGEWEEFGRRWSIKCMQSSKILPLCQKDCLDLAFLYEPLCPGGHLEMFCLYKFLFFSFISKRECNTKDRSCSHTNKHLFGTLPYLILPYILCFIIFLSLAWAKMSSFFEPELEWESKLDIAPALRESRT